jgi:hypothetical protein
MAAHESISKNQFFHGSWRDDFQPGDLIHPSDAGHNKWEPVGPKVHFTPNFNWAGMYGHVYEVEPTDHSQVVNWGDTEDMSPKNERDVEHQKRNRAPAPYSDAPMHEYVSTAPLRVVRRREDLSYPAGHSMDPNEHKKYKEGEVEKRLSK